MNTYLIRNAKIVNEGAVFEGDILIEDEFIKEIAEKISPKSSNCVIIDAEGSYVMPGAIDDQVHFREPGLTHKGTIETESRAAVAGGITSFIEQPNTVPNAVTQELLEDKYQIASQTSYANYSFMMGGTNDNLEEVLKTNPHNVAGIKLFLGSSTGNMLVDNQEVLEKIFSSTKMLIAVHCEDEATIKANLEKYKEEYGEDMDDVYVDLISEISYVDNYLGRELCLTTFSKKIKAMAMKHSFNVYLASQVENTKTFDGICTPKYSRAILQTSDVVLVLISTSELDKEGMVALLSAKNRHNRHDSALILNKNFECMQFINTYQEVSVYEVEDEFNKENRKKEK